MQDVYFSLHTVTFDKPKLNLRVLNFSFNKNTFAKKFFAKETFCVFIQLRH